MGSVFKTPKLPSPGPESNEELLEKDRRKARTNRAALFKTSGGVAGDVLSQGQVSTRNNNLFGN